MLNIAIANDSAIAIEALRRSLLTTPDYQLLWVAQTGTDAIKLSKQHPPDLILMDMHMPHLDGVEATRQIMQQSPCAILIVTASITRHSSMVFKAMSYGALDVVKTPRLGAGDPKAIAVLLKKITTLARYTQHKPKGLAKGSGIQISQTRINSISAGPETGNFDTGENASSSLQTIEQRSPSIPMAGSIPTVLPHNSIPTILSSSPSLPNLVVIGASTGGPGALKTILSQLPKNFNAAIVIIQHIDEQFTSNLVHWLNQASTLPVTLARNGDRPESGKVLVAGGSQHLWMRPNHSVRYTQNPHDYPYRPSVDVFFDSVAKHWQSPGIAILLTGMGKDGAIGMSHLHATKWRTIAENESSCVVFGMPKAAIKLGAVTQTLTVEEITTHLIHHLG